MNTKFFPSFLVILIALGVTAVSEEPAPKDAREFARRGYGKELKQDWKGAIEDYTKAIELDPKRWLSYDSRWSAKMKAGDYQGAIEDSTKIIELNPKNFFGYMDRGDAYRVQKKWKLALDDFEKAEELDEKHELATAKRIKQCEEALAKEQAKEKAGTKE